MRAFLQKGDVAHPGFVIVGCQKGGTSSLHRYLVQHERLFPADIKEVHFFDGGLDQAWDKYAEGEPLYRSYFPKRREVAEVDGPAFEASPCYMFNPLAPARMAQLVPDAKLVALLRDPVERAISHYFHEVRRGRESLDILDALEAESARLAGPVADGDYKDPRWINQSYVTRGRYAEQLARLFEHFDRDRVLVVESGEFFSDPARTVQRVLSFVGIGEAALPINYRPVGVAENKNEVPRDVYDFLAKAFRDADLALADLLERRPSWMMT